MGSILSSGPQPLFLVAAGLSQLVAASFTVHVAARLTFLYLVSLILVATFTFQAAVSLTSPPTVAQYHGRCVQAWWWQSSV